MEDFYTLPGHLVRRVHQISTALFAEECGSHDLTAIQYAALVAIGHNPDVDATRLSDLVSLDRSTIGDVIYRLENKGWVERHPSAGDRRIKLLYLTGEGAAVLDRVADDVTRVQQRLLEPLDAEERETFIRLLRRISDAKPD